MIDQYRNNCFKIPPKKIMIRFISGSLLALYWKHKIFCRKILQNYWDSIGGHRILIVSRNNLASCISFRRILNCLLCLLEFRGLKKYRNWMDMSREISPTLRFKGVLWKKHPLIRNKANHWLQLLLWLLFGSFWSWFAP